MSAITAEIDVSPVAIESATGRRHPVGSLPCQGSWWRPRGAVPRTAIIAAHYSADMSNHFLAESFAIRGYGFLGWNTRYRSGEESFSIEHALIDIGAGVTWLKAQGVERIVLLGNSGGGSLMAAYQSQSVASVFSSNVSIVAAALTQLIPADLYISLNAHAGRADYLTSIIDPAVRQESDPIITDPGLDMYAPSNGPPYDQTFLSGYRDAQADRNRRITAWAEVELNRLTAAGYTDRVFGVPRVWADPRFLDPTIDPSDRAPGWCYAGNPSAANRGIVGMARAVTLRTWLELWSLDRSTCRAGQHLPNVRLPALVIQTTHDVGVFPSDARLILDLLGSQDKTLMMMPGTHFIDAPAGARLAVTEAITGWLADHEG